MRRVSFLAVVLVVLALFAAGSAWAQTPAASRIAPQLKNGQVPFRIGYLQGGEYKDYLPVFNSVIQGLQIIGWLPPGPIPKISAEEGTKGLWTWLSQPGRSPYIEFVADAYYSGDWTEPTRVAMKNQVIQRLSTQKDIDLMIALGTQAGQDLANDLHHVPSLVFSASDAIAAGIVMSAEDSGRNHIWARIDPTRYQRQAILFHNIIGFKRLGIVYENTDEGRSYASVDKIEKTARESGFELIPCYAPFSGVSNEEAGRNVIRCHEQLASNVDALFVTVHRGVSPGIMEELLEPLFEHKIPSFSQAGADEVKYGVLMSISQADYLDQGIFGARTIAQVLSGIPASRLNMIFESLPKLALNLQTAERIGYEPPWDVLAASDVIFSRIEKP